MNPFKPGTEEYDIWERTAAEEPADTDQDDEVGVEVTAEAHRIRIQRKARRIVDAEERPTATLPQVLSLRERLTRPVPPVAWRIEEWQPADARIVLAAQYKAGKTTLTGNVVRSLVDGDAFLGQHKTIPIDGRLGLLDFEMSGRQLDQWYRDQRIVNDDRVIVFPMRGSASAFDIVSEPANRTRWARLLHRHGIVYLVWDCFRPVMDALGLDESREAGRLLVAFDELLGEAGITEALVVHHMGHVAERSRGDSRLRDWPDVEWRLVRQDDEPASPRYISAYGRDVDVSESALNFDPKTRQLSIAGGSRRETSAAVVLKDILDLLAEAPRQSGRAIEKALADTHTQKSIRDALRAGVNDCQIVTAPGPRRSLLHSLSVSALSALPVRQRTQSECVSAFIDNALHSDIAEQPVRRDDPRTCVVCGYPMDTAMAAAGETSHPGCAR